MQSGDFTVLLQRWANGDKQALDALTPVVYAELRKLAASFMRHERPGITLQPTALIHEAYLELATGAPPDLQSRAHFLAVAAHVMRQILIGSARKHRALKRGSGNRVELQDDVAVPAQQCEELLAVDEALERLAERDARKAQVIELKYFGGLTREEIGVALGLTLPTVKRDLALGEAWLRRALGGSVAEAQA